MADLAALLNDARCFRCLADARQVEMQTYILAYAYADLGTDPSALAEASKCLQCLNVLTLHEIRTYLLASLSGQGTDPNVLAELSKCFTCISAGALLSVQTYLMSTDPSGPGITDRNELAAAAKAFNGVPENVLLAIQDYILALSAGVSTDPSSLAALAKCFNCVPFIVLQAVATELIQTVEENGGVVPVDCGTETLILYVRGAGTDAVNGRYDAINPTQWNQEGGPNYYIDTNYGLAGMRAVLIRVSDGAIMYQLPTSQGFPCGTWEVVDGVGPAPTIFYTTEAGVLGNSWADRVVDNGGVIPTQESITATTTFINTLITASLWTKIQILNIYCPDNLTACRTPLIVGPGSDPWGNTGPFVASDLTGLGLKGNGTTKKLEVGATTADVFPDYRSSSIAIYVPVLGDTNYCVGYSPAAGSDNNTYGIRTQFAVNAYASSPYGAAGAGAITAASNGYGYYLVSRNATNEVKLYHAAPDIAHTEIGSNAANLADLTGAFNLSAGGSGGGAYSNQIIGTVMFGEKFSAAESLAFYNAVRTLRIAFSGEEAVAWSNDVVANGGAAPSSATVTAIRTFCITLDTAGLFNKMLSICTFVPDNLIASITPLIHVIGNNPWTNHGFVLADLTVNGMLGDAASKYLDLGFQPSALAAFNHGFTIYNKTASSGAEAELGAWIVTTGFLCEIDRAGSCVYDDSYAAGGGRLSTANAGWAGYVSFNRTANNVQKVFIANSGTAHGQLGATNSNVVADERATVTRNFYALGYNANGVAANFTAKRLSFMAIHQGLTQAESLVLFNAVQALRTAIGGGFV